MVRLIGSLGRLKPIRAIVLGDFVLDRYTYGTVTRISPEAPVPVVVACKQQNLPGMSGNVCLNLASLGASVIALGRIGDDLDGKQLGQILESEQISVEGLCIQKSYQTPIKNRIIAEAQQVVRVDFETLTPISSAVERKLISVCEKYIQNSQIIAISDYGKGLLSKSLLKKVIDLSRLHRIPLIIDPKGEDFRKYRNATMIKPNLSEAYKAAKCSREVPLQIVAKKLLAETACELLLITRSQEGMSLFLQDGSSHHFPVKSKEVKDVTGAGDTVLAMVAMGLANHLDLKQIGELSNFAAGLAIERLGCARISLSDIAYRLLEVNAINKVFDESDLFCLEQILKGKNYLVLALEEQQEITPSLFQTLKMLKTDETTLILYINSISPKSETISFLSSLSEVDFIILKSESLFHLCEEIHPVKTYFFQEEKLISLDTTKRLLEMLS